MLVDGKQEIKIIDKLSLFDPNKAQGIKICVSKPEKVTCVIHSFYCITEK